MISVTQRGNGIFSTRLQVLSPRDTDSGAGVALTVLVTVPLHPVAMPDVNLRESELQPYVNAIVGG